MQYLPEKFLNRMKSMLGEDYDAFLASYDNPNFQALRINTLHTSAKDVLSHSVLVADTEHNTNFSLSQVPWCRDGYYYPETMRPGKHIYHEAGAYYIQEPSAMSPAVYLDAKPGETVLDLCAAPGGKSTQIASMMKQQGLLISNEIHPARAKILSENVERMGITNAVVTNESPQTLATRFVSFFDRIMVDAPCSGEGMFRKNEEACLQWSVENVRICADRQDEILNEADKMLKPGGRIVFSTCTFAPAENEGSIGRFLTTHPEYKLLDVPLYEGMSHGLICDAPLSMCDGFRDVEFAKQVADKVIRLWPHKLNGEGHFVAVLQKGECIAKVPCDANMAERTKKEGLYLLSSPQKKQKPSAHKKGKSKQISPSFGAVDFLAQTEQFMRDTLRIRLSGGILPFGEQLYLLPQGMPSITGLKVLRPGLHLGSIQKNRFEPSHALALTLRPKDAACVCSFSSANKEEYLTACRFVEGQTFPYEGEKGWYLIAIDGISLGWGRLAGGVMKNHYPKGLRKTLL